MHSLFRGIIKAPVFIIPGIQKIGTMALHKYLFQHLSLALNEGTVDQSTAFELSSRYASINEGCISS